MSSSRKKDFEKAFNEGIENNNWTFLNDAIINSVDSFLDNVGDRMNDALGNNRSEERRVGKEC